MRPVRRKPKPSKRASRRAQAANTKPKKKQPSVGEETFAFQCKALGLPAPHREHRFHDVRRWRFDFAWPDRLVAVEIEGGVYVKGRHSRGKAFEEDCVKYNTALLMGWRVFRFSTDHVKRGEAIEMIETVFA